MADDTALLTLVLAALIALVLSTVTIGILTGGGDVPGLNPAIRAVTLRALREARYGPTIGLLQQQHTRIAGDITAVKCRLNTAAFTGWKVKRLLGTFCHGQSPVRFQRKQLNLIELHGLCPSYWRNIQASCLFALACQYAI